MLKGKQGCRESGDIGIAGAVWGTARDVRGVRDALGTGRECRG